MKNNWLNRQVENLGIGQPGFRELGWWIIPNYIWNSGISRGRFYYFLAKIFNPERYRRDTHQ